MPMPMPSKTRALLVVAVGAVAVAIVATQAFGVAHGRAFASTPAAARYGHLPNTLDVHSISPCPAAGQSVSVALMRGTTTVASASTTADSKGRWAVTMSIPSTLMPDDYAVTASCSTDLSYRADTFRVIAPACPVGTTTSTTVTCRVPPSTTTSSSTTTTM